MSGGDVERDAGAELAAERTRRRAAEEALRGEQALRALAERELEIRAFPGGATARRELEAARARIDALEAELTVVRRQASEFEQAIRVAVADAWAWLAVIRERATVALGEVQLPRDATRAAPVGGPPVVAPDRFDAALSRLRDVPGEDSGSPGGGVRGDAYPPLPG